MRSTIERRWSLAILLADSRAGRSVRSVLDELAISRKTFYRDVTFLRDLGAPIVDSIVNGEARYRLRSAALPPLVPRLRRAALELACEALGVLRGSRLFAEIERLRESVARSPTSRAVARAASSSSSAAPEVLDAIERAIDHGRALRVLYRGAKDAEPRERHIVPLEMRLVKGHVYLEAHDLEARVGRTFKVARILAATSAETIDLRSLPAAVSDSASVVVWSGDPIQVEIRIAPEVVRFLAEYPLHPDQTVTAQADGSALVRARVAGHQEVSKWVLGWGRNAEVRSPPSLRIYVRDELAAALGPYQPEPRPERPGVVRALQGVSSIATRGAVKVGKSAGARASGGQRGRG
jgi:proteasome accessory factor C